MQKFMSSNANHWNQIQQSLFYSFIWNVYMLAVSLEKQVQSSFQLGANIDEMPIQYVH